MSATTSAATQVPVPIATPQASPKPEFRLYRVSAVVLATFLGSPLAGGIVMAVNFRRMRYRDRAKQAILVSAALTIGCLVAGMLMGKLATGAGIGSLIAMQRLASLQQGASIDRHAAAGGPFEPWVKAAGIGLVAGVAIFGALFAVLAAGN